MMNAECGIMSEELKSTDYPMRAVPDRPKPRTALILCLLLSAVACPACSITVPSQHIVMFNGLGNPIDPSENFFGKHLSYVPGVTYDQLDNNQYDQQLEKVLNALLTHPLDKHGKRRVLMFIHGGNNTATEAIKRAAVLKGRIADAGYFPIFVNWEASLMTSYFDHLFNVRQGRQTFRWCCNDQAEPSTNATITGAVVGTLTAPFYLATDLSRGVLLAPPTWYTMLFKRDQASALTDTSFPEPGHISISRGADARSKSEQFFAYLDNLNPVKLPASMIVEAGGTGAWDNLVRRTRLLFHREPDLAAPAAFKHFLNRLLKEMPEPDRSAWDLTIVAHSMGTIIANQILRDFPELPIGKIVYMAAACSIRDYQDTLFPYLRDRNKTAELYHLMLHPEAEEEERSVGSFAPDGSLLVWIDEFLSNPSTPLDLTAGRFTNLLPVLRLTPDQIRARVHVKVFGAGEDLLPSQPQTHGGFDEPEFWNEQGFWASVGQPEPHP